MRRVLAALLLVAAVPAGSSFIPLLPSPLPSPPLARAVAVPPGFSTYYFSGAQPAVADPKAPKGNEESYGDITVQTRSVLANLKATLAKLGLTFADVVQAHVYMAPGKDGGIDVAAMNKVWVEEFSAASSNRPARATFKVAGLVAPGFLLEIEMTAAKKAD